MKKLIISANIGVILFILLMIIFTGFVPISIFLKIGAYTVLGLSLVFNSLILLKLLKS